MDSIQLNNIIERSFRQLATIGVTGIYEILSIDDTDFPTDGFDVIKDILQESIDQLEYWEPFTLKMNIRPRNGEYIFIDNFKEVLSGAVPEKYLELIPRVIVAMTDWHLSSLRGINYEAPKLCLGGRSGVFSVNAICTRPVIMKREGNRFTEDSKLYFMGELHKPSLMRLRNLFTMKLCEYLVRLNENTQHPSIPIEQFQGVQSMMSQLQSSVEQSFDISHGYFRIYAK